MTDLIGMIAATLTTLAFLPQALLVLRTGKTEGLSLTMYVMFSIGVAAWLAYGVLLQSLPIIAANSITLLLASAILFRKLQSVHLARTLAA